MPGYRDNSDVAVQCSTLCECVSPNTDEFLMDWDSPQRLYSMYICPLSIESDFASTFSRPQFYIVFCISLTYFHVAYIIHLNSEGEYKSNIANVFRALPEVRSTKEPCPLTFF